MSEAVHSRAKPPVLDVRGLHIAFADEKESRTVVHGLDYSLAAGQTLALVGESGSGKTVSALAPLGLLPANARIEAQSMSFDGKAIDALGLQELRGGSVGVIFQEPLTALNPLHTVRRQIAEAITLHRSFKGQALDNEVLELLHKVHIDDPERRLSAYPHQLSGGQRQRVMIAMALANRPRLLIADEPTTALDLTTQAEILDLIVALQKSEGMALLMITHDLNLVRHMAMQVAILDKGRLVESGPPQQLFTHPRSPVTRALVDAERLPAREDQAPQGSPLLSASGLRVAFQIGAYLPFTRKRVFVAVDGVDLEVRPRETLGIVGESGSGKTTLIEALMRLNRASGRVTIGPHDLYTLKPAALRALRGRMPVVFQDPFGSLSPRMSAGEIIADGLTIHAPQDRAERRAEKVQSIMEEVGLDPAMASRYPHEFSGGQRQRIAIARALILQPDIMFLDEPTSALDKTVQRQVIHLLLRLQHRHDMAFVLVSHDLNVIRALSHRILVMQKGRIVEQGDAKSIFSRPQAPYTQRLLRAATYGKTS